MQHKNRQLKKLTKYLGGIAAVALVLLAFYFVFNHRNSTFDNEFIMADTVAITKIFIADKANNSVTITKKNGQWFVNDSVLAISDNVNIILETMMQIEIKHPISKSSYETNVRRMASTSTKVEIYETLPVFDYFGIRFWYRETATRVFYVGGATQDNTGTMMKMEDSKDIFITYIPGFNGYLTERFSPKIADWKSHEVFRLSIPQIDIVRIEFPSKPEQSYQIRNIDNRTFSLSSLVPFQEISGFDTTRLLELMGSFLKINYETYLDDMNPNRIDSLKNSMPLTRITVKTKLGKTQVLTLYNRQNVDELLDVNGKPFPFDVDRMYAFSSEDRTPFLMQFFVMDNVTRTLSFLKGEGNYHKVDLWE